MVLTAVDLVLPAFAEKRRSRRIEVLLPVEIELRGQRHLGRITELSRAGARLQMLAHKARGDAVVIRRAGVEIRSLIVWTEGTYAGLWFAEPMDEGVFLQLRRTGNCDHVNGAGGLLANLEDRE
jgi:hypothetical protein